MDPKPLLNAYSPVFFQAGGTPALPEKPFFKGRMGPLGTPIS